jgi:protein-disulfide isomerase
MPSSRAADLGTTGRRYLLTLRGAIQEDMPRRPNYEDQARRQRVYQLGALLVTVLAVTAVVVAVMSSGSTSELAPGKPVPGAVRTLALFKDIPQQGIVLGRPDAPVTLVEFGDLKCPSCAIFAEEVLPTIVSHYVRTGKVRLVFRNLDLIGHGSVRAARMAGALGEQNHLWEFIDLMYRNQGAEDSPYVTDIYLRALAGAIPGVNVRRALAQRYSVTVSAQIAQAQAQFQATRFKGTPSFLLSLTGHTGRRFSPSGLESSSFSGPIDKLLAGTR